MSAVPKLRFSEFDGEWQSKKLGEIASFRRGSFPQPYGLPEWYDEENGMPFVQVFDVDDNYQLKPYTKQKISKIAEGKSVFVPKGSIIITIQGSIGRIALTQYDSFVDRTLLIFTGFNEPISNGFFLNVIHLLFEEQKKRAPGGTIKTITKEVLSKFDFYIPSLPEQQKIASFLSSVDKKIDLLRQKKDALELYKKGLMQKIFSQEIRFKQEDGSDFPDWEEVALEDVIKEIGDGGTPDTKNPDYFGGKIPWVVIEDISEKIVKTKTTITELGLRKSSAKIWPKGSLILSTGATIGRVGIAETDVTTKQGICGIILNEGVNYKFIFYVLTWSSPWFLRMAQGNTIKEVRASTVKKMTFGLPSGGEQQKVASFLSAIDTKIQNTSSQIENMETFKKGLLQQMFV